VAELSRNVEELKRLQQGSALPPGAEGPSARAGCPACPRPATLPLPPPAPAPAA
jgi:pilus assembly protein FimV